MRVTAGAPLSAPCGANSLIQQDRPAVLPQLNGQDGFRRLAAATLQTAMEDADASDPHHAGSAIAWLAGDVSGAFVTLEECCKSLGIAPERVRSSLDRHYPNIRARMAQYQEMRSMGTGESLIR